MQFYYVTNFLFSKIPLKSVRFELLEFFFLTEFQISFSLQIHTTYKLANLIAGDLDANKNR